MRIFPINFCFLHDWEFNAVLSSSELYYVLSRSWLLISKLVAGKHYYLNSFSLILCMYLDQLFEVLSCNLSLTCRVTNNIELCILCIVTYFALYSIDGCHGDIVATLIL